MKNELKSNHLDYLNNCVLELETSDVNSVLTSLWFSGEFQQLLSTKGSSPEMSEFFGSKSYQEPTQETVADVIKIVFSPSNVRNNIAGFTAEMGMDVDLFEVYSALGV